MPSSNTMPPWAIRPITPEEVYTDRAEHLAYLHQSALKAIGRRTMPTVLLGQRRMGKTEIFKRVVNRLFFEQDNHGDLHGSVVPVYYSFRDTVSRPGDFAVEYVENFLRWMAAFRLGDPDLAMRESVRAEDLIALVGSNLSMTAGLEEAVALLRVLLKSNDALSAKGALWLPRRVSDRDDSTIVMFLDEFQNTRLPQYGFDIVGLMQEAVESPTCPHFVTGSAMSILAGEILGRGALFGRFESEPIKPLTEYWGAELALRSARFYEAELPEDMAPVVATRCGCNPFYITAVVRQSAKKNKPLLDEKRINEILAVDLSSGFIWGELNDQVSRWIHRLNEYGITKWVLYLSALEHGDRIDLQRIQHELWERDRQEVSIETIRDTLVKLSRGDLLEYMELGGWFRTVDDPILLEFLKVWGRIEVEGTNRERVHQNLLAAYQTLKRKVHHHLGYMGEVYMSQVLWTGQRLKLPGRFFHSPLDIAIPDRFVYIWHRTRLGPAPDMEIDVEAAAGKEMWLCESKWWQGRKAGMSEVESLLYKGDLVRKREGPGLATLRLWFFAHDGFTLEAQTLMQEKGMLWSDREDLNALLSHVGLKRLPEIQEHEKLPGSVDSPE